MKLCSVWVPDAGRAMLCVCESDGSLLPVGGDTYSLADVAELAPYCSTPGASSLEAAVTSFGTGDPVGNMDDAQSAPADASRLHLRAPVRPEEVWAAGVTYERSRDARMKESEEKDVYDRVYEAERPELFFKATGRRVVGPGERVGLRSDSSWQVPEAEVAVVVSTGGRGILGYTLGNDMSSRDIEGANPLYLPQAKIFAGSCALGPMVTSSAAIADPYDIVVRMRIERGSETVFEDESSTARLHQRFDDLVSYLARDNSIPGGTVLLTGTGIVPPEDFALEPGDLISISAGDLGTLRNICAPASELVSAQTAP
jgi:2-dehydro-3-deoxy-D-arabinonate dehydratase